MHPTLSIGDHSDGLRGGRGRCLPFPLPAHKENDEQDANDDDDDNGDDDGDERHLSGGVDIGADADIAISHGQIQLHTGNVGSFTSLAHPLYVFLITLHTNSHCTVLVGLKAVGVDHCMVQCVHTASAYATSCVAS